MIPPKITLHLYLASQAPRAVILRQGPTRTWRMILWHTDTGIFEDGQWLRQKVYAERCALAPDGRHFIYFALNAQWDGPTGGTYTALSRPPWFTALALFAKGDTWGGGGGFLDATRFFADGGPDIGPGDPGLTRVPRPGRDAPPPAPVAPGSAAALAPHLWCDGPRLWRLDGADPVLIRDTSDMAFAPIEAPYG